MLQSFREYRIEIALELALQAAVGHGFAGRNDDDPAQRLLEVGRVFPLKAVRPRAGEDFIENYP